MYYAVYFFKEKEGKLCSNDFTLFFTDNKSASIYCRKLNKTLALQKKCKIKNLENYYIVIQEW